MDVQHRLRGPLQPGKDHPLAILLIDEHSLETLGSLPVNRRILAIDMLFIEQTRGGGSADQEFAQAIKHSGNVVLPFALLTSADLTPQPLLPIVENNAYMRYRNLAASRIFQPQQLLLPIAEFANFAAGLGHVTARPSPDGAIRYDCPVILFEEELYPSLALRLVALINKQPWSSVEVDLQQGIYLGKYHLPLDELGRQWVNYYGPTGTFPIYSLDDFLQGKLKQDVFYNHTVLIGSSVLGNSDRYPSPFDPTLLGVERLATVADNLLTQRWLSRPPWATPLEVFLIILFPIISILLIRRVRISLALSVLIGLAALLLIGAQLLFTYAGYFFSTLFPFFALLLATGLSLGLRARIDESSRRKAEHLLAISEERYALSARGANDGLWDWDILKDQAFFSKRWFELMMDEKVETYANCNSTIFPWSFWLDQLPDLERKRFEREVKNHLQGESRQFYHTFTLGQGKIQRWLLARGVAIRQTDQAVRMAGSLTDITTQKQLEQQVSFNALHDRHTGLANRSLFLAQLQQIISRDGTQSIPEVVIILIDIDRFRNINEKYGDSIGNILLNEVACRLRELEHTGCLIARLGGDLFGIACLAPVTNTLVQQVRESLNEPFVLENNTTQVPMTIAVAHTSQGLITVEDLFNAVHLALLNGKQQSPGQIHNFDPAEQAQENRRWWLKEQLDRAITAGDQFKLFYQPLVRLSDRQLVGFEALIRWYHPEQGLISPGEFIPFAEEGGQIIEIGRWTLYESCRQLKRWDKLGFQGEIAVNLSGRQFSHTDLEAEAQQMLAILDPLPASRIKLEITESMSMAQPEHTIKILEKLVEMGFKIAIDDFGTGYSSLAYLHRFPFDVLKIDRSFVVRLGVGREAREVVRTIISLATALDKITLAEGIEDEFQAQQLIELGVHIGQGWLFDKALPVEDATARIVSSN